MDFVLADSALFDRTKIDWSSLSSLTDYFSYDFATGSVQGYLADKDVPMKRQKTDDGLVLPVLAPALNSKWHQTWHVKRF